MYSTSNDRVFRWRSIGGDVFPGHVFLPWLQSLGRHAELPNLVSIRAWQRGCENGWEMRFYFEVDFSLPFPNLFQLAYSFLRTLS